jgi:hypothetical protein
MDDIWWARSTGARPLTVNRVAGMHRQAWATHTRRVRTDWGWLWRAAKPRPPTPISFPIEVRVIPLHSSKRSPQDVAACAPEAKAAIDALVDIGALIDDGPAYVRRVTFCAPDIGDVDGMEVHVSRYEP